MWAAQIDPYLPTIFLPLLDSSIGEGKATKRCLDAENVRMLMMMMWKDRWPSATSVAMRIGRR